MRLFKIFFFLLFMNTSMLCIAQKNKSFLFEDWSISADVTKNPLTWKTIPFGDVELDMQNQYSSSLGLTFSYNLGNWMNEEFFLETSISGFPRNTLELTNEDKIYRSVIKMVTIPEGFEASNLLIDFEQKIIFFKVGLAKYFSSHTNVNWRFRYSANIMYGLPTKLLTESKYHGYTVKLKAGQTISGFFPYDVTPEAFGEINIIGNYTIIGNLGIQLEKKLLKNYDCYIGTKINLLIPGRFKLHEDTSASGFFALKEDFKSSIEAKWYPMANFTLSLIYAMDR